MKIVSSSIQIATLILISCTFLFAGQHEQLWEYKEWQVDTHNDFVRCVTHGQVVHGHEFAIVKRKGSNNQNLLYISWSTSNKGLTKHKGKDAVLRLQIDDIRRQVTIPLLSVKELHPGLTIGTFTNIAVGEEFISLLKQGHKLEVMIHGPDELVGALDITSDTFSLDGFTATMLKAHEFCKHPTSQSGLSNTDKMKQKAKAELAANCLGSLLSVQKEIVALDGEHQKLAILLSAGALNSKLSTWGKTKVNEGSMTPEQGFYIMSLSTTRLALLTQAVNMNDATICHVKEADALMSMSKGNKGLPVNCRQQVYGSLQVPAVRNAHGPEADKISELANKWATEAILFSKYSAEIDNYGNKPKAQERHIKAPSQKERAANSNKRTFNDSIREANNLTIIPADLEYLLTKELQDKTIFQTKTHHIAYIIETNTIAITSKRYSYSSDFWGHYGYKGLGLGSTILIENISNNKVQRYRELFEKFLKWYDINQNAKLFMPDRTIGSIEDVKLVYQGYGGGSDPKHKDNLMIKGNSGILFLYKKEVEKILKFFTEENISTEVSKAIREEELKSAEEKRFAKQADERERQRKEKIEQLFN
jgi:hypothetical protein